MPLFNFDEISLMAFSTSEVVDAWREDVIASERLKTQKLSETRYTEIAHRNIYDKAPHVNTYTQIAHTDVYSRTASSDIYSRTDTRDTYDRVAHTNVYTRVAHTNAYSQRAHRDSYSNYGRGSYHNYYSESYRRTAHRNSYRRSHNNRYSKIYGVGTGYAAVVTRYTRYSRGSYTRRAHVNYSRGSYTAYYSKDYSRRYSKSAHTNSYSREGAVATYSKVIARDLYTKVAHTDVYTRGSAIDVYTQVTPRDTYDRTAHYDVYSRVDQVDKGFDHLNYIPSPPALYEIDGKVIEDRLEVKLASYDKNKDGFGSQDTNSKDIYYIIKIRQIQDLAGNPIEGKWHTLQNKSMSEETTFNVEEFEDGLYEISTQGYNLPRTEKGVTKTYVSDENIYTFTIFNSDYGGKITVVNSSDFYDYKYGNETFADRDDAIHKYVDSILYPNAPEDKQKGMFLELNMDDNNNIGYHKTQVCLTKFGKELTSYYDVVYETSGSGQKTGDKKGIVFIPLSDMLDSGSYQDVMIKMKTKEYRNQAMTMMMGEEYQQFGINQAEDVIYVDVDGYDPIVLISKPKENVASQKVLIEYGDIGLGIKEKKYQVVKAGELPSNNGWEDADSTSFYLTLNELGAYDIYAKVVDKAGNEKTTVKKAFDVNEDRSILNVPPSVTRGSEFFPTVRILKDKEVQNVEIWIENYTEKTIASKTIDNKHYRSDITSPDTIPLGEHLVFAEITYKDGEKELVSRPITITAATPSALNKGPRFISEEYLETINKDSKWKNAENQKTLENSFNNKNPETYHIGGDDEGETE